ATGRVHATGRGLRRGRGRPVTAAPSGPVVCPRPRGPITPECSHARTTTQGHPPTPAATPRRGITPGAGTSGPVPRADASGTPVPRRPTPPVRQCPRRPTPAGALSLTAIQLYGPVVRP